MKNNFITMDIKQNKDNNERRTNVQYMCLFSKNKREKN